MTKLQKIVLILRMITVKPLKKKNNYMKASKTLRTNITIFRKECDSYLATVSRHLWSRQITMKIDKLL